MSSLANIPFTGLEAALVVSAAFLLTVLFTKPLIGWLEQREFGKAIRVDGPDHAEKAGTPTMGGLAMLGVIGIVSLYVSWRLDTYWTLGIPITMAVFGSLGLLDDLQGLARKSGGEMGVGLTARSMFALQVLAAGAVILLFTPAIYLLPEPTDLAGVALAALTLSVGIVVVVGTVNGVNMSDGLDGLAAGLCAIAYTAIGLLSLIDYLDGRAIDEMAPMVGLTMKPSYLTLAIYAFVIAAACLGFLVYNRHPAHVFMGNVTSMALGAGLPLLAVHSGHGLLLFTLVAVVFVVEVISVLMQVTYFKATGGKRIFRIAPIHHHFEALGWSEVKVVRRFWIAGVAGAAASVAIALVLRQTQELHIY